MHQMVNNIYIHCSYDIMCQLANISFVHKPYCEFRGAVSETAEHVFKLFVLPYICGETIMTKGAHRPWNHCRVLVES